MSNKPNPDDRTDNMDRIQRNIDHTIQNIEAADELMAETDNRQIQEELATKNQRRERALDGMRAEIRDEAENSKKR